MMAALHESEAIEMLHRDDITVEQLMQQLEQRRRITHELIVLIEGDNDAAFEKYAPCSHMQYVQCPLRCTGRNASACPAST